MNAVMLFKMSRTDLIADIHRVIVNGVYRLLRRR